jgi:hypothetical protein
MLINILVYIYLLFAGCIKVIGRVITEIHILSWEGGMYKINLKIM